ncbi:MAG: DUF4830 domain-containing protein [Oscillospiraceae bacterium]|nr:DUF4830 domain-containing protein [Oscillospiraceae bacterium]
MFILSFKTSRLKLITAGVAVLAAFLTIIYAISSMATAQTGVKPEKKTDATDNGQRLEFIRSFGYQAKSDPVEVAEIIIPTEFDEVYLDYNKMQKEQGYDLTGFRGKRVKRYTYEITNYPEHSAGVRADILVSDGKVIGGNVCSILEGGFIHGFSAPVQ